MTRIPRWKNTIKQKHKYMNAEREIKVHMLFGITIIE